MNVLNVYNFSASRIPSGRCAYIGASNWNGRGGVHGNMRTYRWLPLIPNYSSVRTTGPLVSDGFSNFTSGTTAFHSQCTQKWFNPRLALRSIHQQNIWMHKVQSFSPGHPQPSTYGQIYGVCVSRDGGWKTIQHSSSDTSARQKVICERASRYPFITVPFWFQTKKVPLEGFFFSLFFKRKPNFFRLLPKTSEN